MVPCDFVPIFNFLRICSETEADWTTQLSDLVSLENNSLNLQFAFPEAQVYLHG